MSVRRSCASGRRGRTSFDSRRLSGTGGHIVSKNGMGAVMGSKNLKAVVVRGTKGRTYADHQKVWELCKTMTMNPQNQYLSKGSRLDGITAWPASYCSNPSSLEDFSMDQRCLASRITTRFGSPNVTTTTTKTSLCDTSFGHTPAQGASTPATYPPLETFPLPLELRFASTYTITRVVAP
jgi:hypothetical protein